MLAYFRAQIWLHPVKSQFHSFLNPLSVNIPKLPPVPALIFGMAAQSGSTKRPTCPSCSKPTSICLCNRLQTPVIDNSVAVTILQHSLEKKHPLNSARIATIGLKNVHVITVSDVNYQARFFIRLLDSSCGIGRPKLDENSYLFDEMPSEGENVELVGTGILGNTETDDIDVDGHIMERSGYKYNGTENRQISKNVTTSSGNLGFNPDLESGCGEMAVRSCTSDEAVLAEKGEVVIARDYMETYRNRKVALRGSEVMAINFTITKYGAISSFHNYKVAPDKCQEMSFDQLMVSDIGVDDIRTGLIVKKLERKLLEGSNEYEESEEFEVAVPPGSVLLFPSERSVDVEEVDFEVKNLIVLDGTWAKAKRMYNENPWLRLLPHIRLDLDKLSLYSEVRRQPRAGYLSTIESIVYAMKAVGEDTEGLDGVLDVFESMVGDQRRCKNERLSKASEK